MWPNKKPNRARPVMATRTFLPIDEFQMRVNQFTSLLLDGCPCARTLQPERAVSCLGMTSKKRWMRPRHLCVSSFKNKTNTQDQRSEEHTSELQSRGHLVCRLLLEKKNKDKPNISVIQLLKARQ